MTQGRRKSSIHIPTWREIAYGPTIYGLLYSDEFSLNYLNLEDRSNHLLATDNCILSMILKEDEVIYNTLDNVKYLLKNDRFTAALDGTINTIQDVDGKISFAAKERWVQYKGFRYYIPQKRQIHSLLQDEAGNPFALTGSAGGCVVYLTELFYGDKLAYGKDVWKCNSSSMTPNATLIPWGKTGGNKKNYPFSILGCISSRYLDLNGEEIKGTRVGGRQAIQTVKCPSISGDTATVFYADYFLRKLIRAEIDLKKMELMKKEVLLDDISDYIKAIEPVTTESLHQKLIERGEPI